jgi:hypothetical protein
LNTPAYPLVGFTLEVGTWDTAGEGYPDTGFEGGVTIPVGCGREVLAEPQSAPFRMADGTTVHAPSWTGVLEVDGHRFTVEVIAIGDSYLIGREILDQLEICFSYGREVRLSFRPERSPK